MSAPAAPVTTRITILTLNISLTWCTELAALVVEYCVMAELAEQVDLRTLASARDFSIAHFVI